MTPQHNDPAHREIYRKIRQHDKKLAQMHKRQIAHWATLLSLLIGDIISRLLSGSTFK